MIDSEAKHLIHELTHDTRPIDRRGRTSNLRALLNEQRALGAKLSAAIRETFPLGTVIEYPLPGKIRVIVRGAVEKHKVQGHAGVATLLIRTPDRPTLLTKTVSDLNLADIRIISQS